MATLSVAMPTYNHAKFLRRSLDAILSQSRLPDEVLVVNDASPDETEDILAEYTKRHAQVRVIRNPTNMGVVASLNIAFKECRSDYIYGAASDDTVVPGFFKNAMSLLERHPEAGLLCGKIAPVSDGMRQAVHGISRWNESGYKSPAQFLEDWLYGEPAGHSLGGGTVFHRQRLIDVGGFRRELASWTDTFACYALARRHGLCYLDSVAMEWHTQTDGYAASVGRDPEQLRAILKAGEAIMRSPEFADCFPDEYVRRWELSWRLITLNEVELLNDIVVRRQFPDLRTAYIDVAKTANPFDRSVGFLLRTLLFFVNGPIQRKAWNRFERWRSRY